MDTKLKMLIMLLLAATLLSSRGDNSVNDASLAEDTARIAKTLDEVLGDNWQVKANKKEITLTSKFEVFWILLISRGSPPPEFSDKTSRKTLMTETQPSKYVIHLRVEPAMSSEIYMQRSQEKHKLMKMMSANPPIKDMTAERYEAMMEQFDKIELPRYRYPFCDIYEQLPDWRGSRIYPPKALQKIGGAKEILRVMLYQPPTEFEKSEKYGK